MTMAVAMHGTVKREVASKRHDLFDRFFDDFPEALRRPLLFWPERTFDPMRVEEFVEDGTLVVRVEIAGIDPDKDLDLSLEGDMLHVRAERREEEKAEGRYYVRSEHRYGSFQRDIPLPKATSEEDIHARYADGILEVRVLVKEAELRKERRIQIAKG
jgi:HSP20 family protein